MSLTSIVYLQSCQKEKDELIVNKNESEMVVNKIIGGTPNPSRVFGLSTIGTQHNEYMDYYINHVNIASSRTPSAELQTMRTYMASKGQDPSELTFTEANIVELNDKMKNGNMSIASCFVFDPDSNMEQLREQEVVREYYVKLDQLINNDDFIDLLFSGNINSYLSNVLNIADEIKNHPNMKSKYKANLMYCYEIAYYSGSYWSESIHNTTNEWHSYAASSYYSATSLDISNIKTTVGTRKPPMATSWAVKKIFSADVMGAAWEREHLGNISNGLFGSTFFSSMAACLIFVKKIPFYTW